LRDDPHLADDVVFGSSGDLAVEMMANDPDCPIKGMPSIRFDMRLSRESAATRPAGAVGATRGDHEAIGASRNRSGGSRRIVSSPTRIHSKRPDKIRGAGITPTHKGEINET